MFTKKTIRKMPWYTRKFAREINTLELTLRRLKCMLPQIQTMEMEAKALYESKAYTSQERLEHDIAPDDSPF